MIRFRRALLIIIFIVGFALVLEMIRLNYIIQWSKSKNDFQKTDLKLAVVLTKDQLQDAKPEKFLIIFDREDAASKNIVVNVSQVLNHMKKTFLIRDVRDFQGVEPDVMTAIVTFADWDKLPGFMDLITYAQRGGRVFIAQTPLQADTFFALSRQLGIYETGDWFLQRGARLLTDVMVAAKGLSLDAAITDNFSISVRLTESAKVHAENTSGNPLLWEIAASQGRIMFFNGTMLAEKVHRGIIAGSLSLLNDDFIYPVINTKVVFIDSFPSPLSGSIKLSEKDSPRRIEHLVRDVWWPEIVSSMVVYDVKYTAAFIETLTDRVNPPFVDPPDLNTTAFLLYGRELLKYGGEIGLQGYNPQPLMETGFSVGQQGVWAGPEAMAGAVGEAVRFATEGFPYYDFRVYVPPANLLSPMGEKALRQSMPDLGVLSAGYLDPEREFEVKDHVVSFPRITYGYSDDPYTGWLAANGITLLGVLSHYIRPDDMFYEREKGVTWEMVWSKYEAMLGRIKSKYSWLRSMTASQAGEEVIKYSFLEPFFKKSDKGITIYSNNTLGPVYYMIRTNKKISPSRDYEVVKLDESRYLLKTEKPVLFMELERKP